MILANGGAVVLLIAAGSILSEGGKPEPATPAGMSRLELEHMTAANAYEVIEAARPDWLTTGRAGSSPPAAYLKIRCSELTCLRLVELDQVEGIQFIRPRDTWYSGRDTDSGGGIVVTLRPTTEDGTGAAAR
jgi:hypothetical protein